MDEINVEDVEPGELTAVVGRTLAAMPWHTPADAAMRELALKLAAAIDDADARAAEYGKLDGTWGRDEDAYFKLLRLEAWCDVAKTVALLAPKLRDVLRDLGGAPGVRTGMDTAPKANGHLARLRAVDKGA